MDDCIYIDTTPGRSGPFCPQGPVEDYAAWLMERYQSHQMKHGAKIIYYGLAQRLNRVIAASRTPGHQVMAFGPYAGAAATALESMGSNEVEVLV